ncbi:Gamma-glutamylcyclotransferase family protein [Aphelenchoides fujianensis]|nr:Gamma-glutamylcyclotransferase family protein [Aphelenchoides fujianensis]
MAEFFVFVYGTLKKGEPNAATMMDGAGGRSRFVGEAETVRQFPLIISTQFNIPFLLKDPGRGKKRVNCLLFFNLVDETAKTTAHSLRFNERVESKPPVFVSEARLQLSRLQPRLDFSTDAPKLDLSSLLSGSRTRHEAPRNWSTSKLFYEAKGGRVEKTRTEERIEREERLRKIRLPKRPVPVDEVIRFRYEPAPGDELNETDEWLLEPVDDFFDEEDCF